MKKKRTRSLDDLLSGNGAHPPRPWEMANGTHPYVFRCTQGETDFWLHHLWLPFWCSLGAEQQEEIKKEAPDHLWIEWLNRTPNKE